LLVTATQENDGGGRQGFVAVKETASEIERRKRPSEFVEGEIVCRWRVIEGEIKGRRKLSSE
jgi:DNA/RNA endonuclease YhcR with UshA esterase domain